MAETSPRPSARHWVIRFAISGGIIGCVAGWSSFSGPDRWSGLLLAGVLGALIGAAVGSGYEASLGSVLGWLRGGRAGWIPMSTRKAINLALFRSLRRHDVPGVFRGETV